MLEAVTEQRGHCCGEVSQNKSSPYILSYEKSIYLSGGGRICWFAPKQGGVGVRNQARRASRRKDSPSLGKKKRRISRKKKRLKIIR